MTPPRDWKQQYKLAWPTGQWSIRNKKQRYRQVRCDFVKWWKECHAKYHRMRGMERVLHILIWLYNIFFYCISYPFTVSWMKIERSALTTFVLQFFKRIIKRMKEWKSTRPFAMYICYAVCSAFTPHLSHSRTSIFPRNAETFYP